MMERRSHNTENSDDIMMMTLHCHVHISVLLKWRK